ncbi:MAG: adenosylhomocysteinase [Heliobacteriaceae bacterium]|nr:adenosylhomocysteinase [Heliobacteriaceae bacterium]MDD4586805.1 adenosylhomocysteinase [Heliobacteriaceae bacterium]
MIRDLGLAGPGQRKIDWVALHMPVLNRIKMDFTRHKPLAGKKVAICLHLEAKTAYLALTLQAAGADVAVCASNPLSTQDDVVAALVANGVKAFAWHGATDDEYNIHLTRALDCQPDLLIDDGGDLVTLLHTERPEQARHIIGGAEETTTGLHRLRLLAAADRLLFPMMAVNDARMKYLFDNRYGTGQSVWDGIMRTTNLVVAGKVVVVAGYGWCGKGVASRAKGLGARVIVTEIDPVKANEALMDGFSVMPMQRAAQLGDVFVTTTGNRDIIKAEHFTVIKDKAILANAGHFDVEINKQDLAAVAVEVATIRQNVEEYTFRDGRKVFLLGEGRLVNLAAGDGHPAEVMDLSFGIQALALAYLNENQGVLKPGVYPVSAEIDRKVAELRLAALGIMIDHLTPIQQKYLSSTW